VPTEAERGGVVITVVNTLKLYEVDGIETRPVEPPSVRIESHWNNSNLVVLIVGDKRYTLVARDLMAAIGNATNTGR